MALVKKVRKLGARGGFSAAQRDTSGLRPLQVPGSAPCGQACPNGTDVRGVLTSVARAAKAGRPLDEALDEAFWLLAERNPIPAISALVCPHHCEEHCHRAGYDEPLSINQVEQYLSQRALERALSLQRPAHARACERIAVAGAGAAGLSAAYQLVRQGHQVTVFDAGKTAAHALLDGLPGHVVPRELVEAEVERLLAFGLEFRTDAGVGKAVWTPPGDEGFARLVRTRVAAPGQILDPAGIVPAVCFGRHLAEAVGAELSGRPARRPAKEPVVARDRVKPDHFPHRARLRAVQAPAAAPESASETAGRRTVPGDDTRGAPAITVEEILAEAERCFSCGACNACDNCYKYCPEQAVVRPLDSGQPYRFTLEFCNGCGTCVDQCPAGYIEMR